MPHCPFFHVQVQQELPSVVQLMEPSMPISFHQSATMSGSRYGHRDNILVSYHAGISSSSFGCCDASLT
jgi:hypothetical protein